MKSIIITTAAAGLLACSVFISAVTAQTSTKTRLIMMADMGNEPDEMQQNVHMLMYSNMFDLEGLCAVTGLYLTSSVRPDLYTQLVTAYGQIYNNLLLHASGWPTPDYLQSIVKGGIPGYGKAAVGSGKSSPASNLIKDALVKNDPRPLYLVGNAGTNNLLQALWDLDSKHFGTKNQSEMDAITKKIIVFENGSQDNCGAWIAGEYPLVAWHRSNELTYCYGGGTGEATEVAGPNTWGPFPFTTQGQASWSSKHIMNNHGALGTKYPNRNGGNWYLEGGGTIPWMGLANHGLADPKRLWWGGWSGRFSKVKERNVYSNKPSIKPDEQKYIDFYMYNSDSQSDMWTDPHTSQSYTGYQAAIYRFRRAMWNDFRARMDWCVKPYNQANHCPAAAVNGDTLDTIIAMTAAPGQVVSFDASASKDPDNDSLKFNWFIYKEAGTYTGTVAPTTPLSSKTSITIPADANGKEIHLVLEISDSTKVVDTSGHPNMYDYRRIVINVSSTDVLNARADYRMSKGSATFFTAGDELVLPADCRDQAYRLAIFDLSGKCARSVVVKQRVISLSRQLSLTPGAYLVKVQRAK